MASTIAEQSPPAALGSSEGPDGQHSASSPAKPPSTKLLVVLLVVATALPFLPTLQYGFVYDDIAVILPTIAAQASQTPFDYFITSVWDFRHPAVAMNLRYYRPLQHLWVRLNALFFGYDATGWHLSTVAVHLAVTVLVFLLLRRHFHQWWAAFIGAMVFGLHPVHIESVAWVIAVVDPLATLAVLASFLFWLRNVETPAIAVRACSLAFFAAALLTKENSIALPAIIFFYVLIENSGSAKILENKKNRVQAAIWEALPYAVIAVMYLGVRKLAVPPMRNASLPWVPHREAILTLPSVVVFYLRHLVWPSRLTVFPDIPLVSNAKSPGLWIPLLMILGAAAASAWWLWRDRAARGTFLPALAWLWLPLLPVLNLAVFFKDDFAHDRYLYLPSIGLAFFCAGAGSLLLGERTSAARRWIGLAAATALVSALAVSTAAQSAAWQSNLSLFTSASQLSANPVPRVYLAAEYLDRGHPQEAREILERVVDEHPDLWNANYYLGAADYQLRDLPPAERYLRRAIALDPAEPDEYLKLGLTMLAENRPADAETQVRIALGRNPEGEGYHFALGVILMTEGRRAAAQSELQEELQRSPNNVAMRTQIENLLAANPGRAGAPAVSPAPSK